MFTLPIRRVLPAFLDRARAGGERERELRNRGEDDLVVSDVRRQILNKRKQHFISSHPALCSNFFSCGSQKHLLGCTQMLARSLANSFAVKQKNGKDISLVCLTVAAGE